MDADERKHGMGELRMQEGALRETGIGSSGVVMRGERSVEEAMYVAARKVRRELREQYGSVTDYDPVLRYHCRL